MPSRSTHDTDKRIFGFGTYFDWFWRVWQSVVVLSFEVKEVDPAQLCGRFRVIHMKLVRRTFQRKVR